MIQATTSLSNQPILRVECLICRYFGQKAKYRYPEELRLVKIPGPGFCKCCWKKCTQFGALHFIATYQLSSPKPHSPNRCSTLWPNSTLSQSINTHPECETPHLEISLTNQLLETLLEQYKRLIEDPIILRNKSKGWGRGGVYTS